MRVLSLLIFLSVVQLFPFYADLLPWECIVAAVAICTLDIVGLHCGFIVTYSLYSYVEFIKLYFVLD